MGVAGSTCVSTGLWLHKTQLPPSFPPTAVLPGSRGCGHQGSHPTHPMPDLSLPPTSPHIPLPGGETLLCTVHWAGGQCRPLAGWEVALAFRVRPGPLTRHGRGGQTPGGKGRVIPTLGQEADVWPRAPGFRKLPTSSF